ncbi:Sialic acid TRAP transporter large permease protein SiaM [subsurface metagenome]
MIIDSPFFMFFCFLLLILLGIPIVFAMIIMGVAFVIFFGGGIEAIITPFHRLGLAFSFSLIAVFFFITLGKIMNESKISDYLINFVRQLIRRFNIQGATGIITILSCAACGPLTGSAVGTTTAVGGIMIPQMNKIGYDYKYSTTLLAYSGILGSFIPPSISGLIYAIIVGLSVFTVWTAVCGAGLLYMLSLVVGHYILSKKRNYEHYDSFNDSFNESKENLYKTFIKALPALIVPVGVLGSIYGGIATPTEAGSVGVLITLLLGIFVYKTIYSVKQIIKVLYTSAVQTAIVMFLVCGSFSLSYSLTVTGVVKDIARSMLLLSSNKYILLLLTEGLLLILGCFLDDTPIMILLAPIASAILIPVGIHPYHLATVFVYVCLVGLVTPPVGTVLYAASAVSKVSIGKILKELLIFFIPALVILLLITFFPQISFFLPKLFGLL